MTKSSAASCVKWNRRLTTLPNCNVLKERVELLGYFDNVNSMRFLWPNTPDQVDLNMSLTERSTGSLDLSAGWVQDTGLVMSAGVAQDNLFGTGKSVALRASRSKTTVNGSLSFTDPYFTPDGVSLGYDIYGKTYDPRKASSSAKQYKTTTFGGGLRYRYSGYRI